jgi:hypothetical protein
LERFPNGNIVNTEFTMKAHCGICGKQFEKRCGRHKYCDACRAEARRGYDRNARKNNPDREKERHRRKYTRQIKTLGDSYIKHKLSDLGIKSPTSTMIALKREKIKLFRKIKHYEKQQRNTTHI